MKMARENTAIAANCGHSAPKPDPLRKFERTMTRM